MEESGGQFVVPKSIVILALLAMCGTLLSNRFCHF